MERNALALLWLAVACASLAACGGTTASVAGKAAPASPMSEHEPNDGSISADGPVGAAGIVLRSKSDGDEDFIYFKLRAGRSVKMTVRHLSGRCSETFFETVLPGRTGPDNGGQDQTAIR